MKYFLIVLATALVVGLGVTAYFKGWLPTVSFGKPQAVSTVGSEEVANPTLVPQVSPQASSSGNMTMVEAGGVLVFNKYSLELPQGWTHTKEGAPSGDIELDKLTLSSGAYTITIYQAATGGALCLYPGDPDSEGPSSRFTSFTEITTSTGEKLRRGTSQGAAGFTVCEEQAGNWGQPTSFGHISITTPSSPAVSKMLEIDSILTSLKKI